MTAEEIAELERRAVAAHAAVAEGARLQAENSPVLRDSVKKLRHLGRSHGQIAALLGVTRSRAQQLASEP